MNTPRHSLSALLLGGLLLLMPNAAAHAGSATWNLNPTNGDWNTATNWTPETVPNGPADTATFDVSNTTGVSLSADTEVDSILFEPGASAFTVTVPDPLILHISGQGLTNNSGIMQNLITMATTAGELTSIQFSGDATAGSQTVITNGAGELGGLTTFTDNTSAGSVTIINNASDIHGLGAETEFFGQASADSSTIINNGAATVGGSGGRTFFYDNATAGTGTFIANGGLFSFLGNSTAGNGTFTINGGIEGAQSTQVVFKDSASVGGATFTINDGGRFDLTEFSTAGDATMLATGGPKGGGFFLLRDTSTGGTARFKVFQNAAIDISLHLSPGIAIGSLEGDGHVFLGRQQLRIGTNNLSTTFSGVIGNNGKLTKVGTGTLTLSGANIYTGVTTVSAGVLRVQNTTGSATGSGPVQVSGGLLGGKGIIAGSTTVGTGSGAGSFLQPGKGASTATTLTIQNTLTFKGNGNYTWKLNTKKAKADQVIASGVTIEPGAQFDFDTVGNKKLTIGKVFTAISNTAATGISGTFANLADGSIVTAGVNTLQVNYSDGDGNDLTLTVVP